jgi:hypothetical protein
MLLVPSTLFLVFSLLALIWHWHTARSTSPFAVAGLVAGASGVAVTLPQHLTAAVDPAFLVTLALVAVAYLLHTAYLPDLARRVAELELTKETSRNWSAAWRRTQLAERTAEYEHASEQLLAAWMRERNRTFRMDAFAALLFFGRDFDATRELFLENVKEYRRRYDLITGGSDDATQRPIPSPNALAPKA